jgi:hypothetical protein
MSWLTSRRGDTLVVKCGRRGRGYVGRNTGEMRDQLGCAPDYSGYFKGVIVPMAL